MWSEQRWFSVLVSYPCFDLTFLVDITTESKPFAVANYQVPESSGAFCDRGGRFGPHSTNDSFTQIYYKKLVFIAALPSARD
jgi:hypothetical protein